MSPITAVLAFSSRFVGICIPLYTFLVADVFHGEVHAVPTPAELILYLRGFFLGIVHELPEVSPGGHRGLQSKPYAAAENPRIG